MLARLAAGARQLAVGQKVLPQLLEVQDCVDLGPLVQLFRRGVPAEEERVVPAAAPLLLLDHGREDRVRGLPLPWRLHLLVQGELRLLKLAVVGTRPPAPGPGPGGPRIRLAIR